MLRKAPAQWGEVSPKGRRLVNKAPMRLRRPYNTVFDLSTSKPMFSTVKFNPKNPKWLNQNRFVLSHKFPNAPEMLGYFSGSLLTLLVCCLGYSRTVR